jgi:hypothetical protein
LFRHVGVHRWCAVGDDGSVTPDGRSNNWLQTVAGKGLFAILRLYNPRPSLFDKTWRPQRDRTDEATRAGGRGHAMLGRNRPSSQADEIRGGVGVVVESCGHRASDRLWVSSPPTARVSPRPGLERRDVGGWIMTVAAGPFGAGIPSGVPQLVDVVEGIRWAA